jgi:hypothetical protein
MVAGQLDPGPSGQIWPPSGMLSGDWSDSSVSWPDSVGLMARLSAGSGLAPGGAMGAGSCVWLPPGTNLAGVASGWLAPPRLSPSCMAGGARWVRLAPRNVANCGFGI